ncbi:MAG: hypothetical protein M3N95_09040 [Actinomycetota bacterium]|nr:hypothetical protein [Actinomycetota bacterium]
MTTVNQVRAGVPTSSAGQDPAEAAIAAEQRMYDAEVALHLARQTRVDEWISVAYDRLHEAILKHAQAVDVANLAGTGHAR